MQKRVTCPKCSPDYRVAHTLTFDLDAGKDVWRCEGCGNNRPVYRSPKAPTKPTPSQESMLEQIVEKLERFGRTAEVTHKKLGGRKLFVIVHQSGTLGISVSGSIGPRGGLDLEVWNPLSGTKKVNSIWKVN